MRHVPALLALAVLAAGCVGPEPLGPEPNLLGYCPQWVQGPGQHTGNVVVDADNLAASVRITPEALRHDGLPLDLYRLRIDALNVTGGQLHLHAYTEGNQTGGRNWYDYRSAGQPFQSVPFLVFRGTGNETGREFDVVLSPLRHADPQDPLPIQLTWRLQSGDSGPAHASVAFTVTYHYRVCGI